MNDDYAAMFVFDPADGMVLCATDPKYPEDQKMMGGLSLKGKLDEATGKVVKETPLATAIRELLEESRTQVTECTLMFVETIVSRGGESHTRYFFLADKIGGALEKGATWSIEEKNADNVVVEKLTAQWVPLREFADKIFKKQIPAFGAILAELARRNVDFCYKYADLLERFPEPENLGLN